MPKLATGILITVGLIIFVAVSFTLYAQFALDYSLESLRGALEASQQDSPTSLSGYTYRSSIEGLVFEEMSRPDAELETVVLLEHAARSIRDAVERSGYTRASVYLAEALKQRVDQRHWLLRGIDAAYHFTRNVFKTLQGVWDYLWRRLRALPEPPAMEGTSVLILGEAERMERVGKLEEARLYYQEFLNRYPDRPERGFVSISLAHVLTKMRRFEEARGLLERILKEFPGSREEVLASSHLSRIAGIQQRLARLPELENWIKAQPERIFEEKGGLALALDYLATYQTDRALTVLEKLEQAPDPRIRTKALFYRAWIHKWEGDLDKGKVILESLRSIPLPDEKVSFAVGVELAEVHYEKKEYQQALNLYEELSRRAVAETWRALSELEQGQIYLFGFGDAEAARQTLLRLEQVLPRVSSEFALASQRLQEAFQRSLRDEGFTALAQGHLDIAFKIFGEYLNKFPRDGVVHAGMASIYLLQGLLNEAVEAAERGYGLTRTEYTAAVLGYVYEKMGKLDEAMKYYQISMQIKSSYLTAQFNLAWVYAMTGRYNEAERLLAKLETVRPKPSAATQAKILNNHGCVFWALGRKEEAAARFQEALKIMPTLTEARDNLNLAAGERPTPALIEIPL